MAENAARVLERCSNATVRSGRAPGAVRLVAACKTQPLERALAVTRAGVTDLGENRVQEAEAKWGITLESGVVLHMIGQLQRNKVRRALALFDTVHSCDSLEVARRISDLAGDRAASVLLQVNVAAEPTKAGFSPAELRAQLAHIATLPGLNLGGLMTLAPAFGDAEGARPVFQQLRLLSEELRAEYPALGNDLSMGMTDDYEVAIEEGATMVRVGRAIYGERPLP